MKTEGKNSYIINHAIRVYLTAAILNSVVGQLNTTIDGIIVSNAVSPDALSSVALAFPVLTIASFLGFVIYEGAGLLIAPALGSQRFLQVNRIFTISLGSVLLINGVIGMILSCQASFVAGMLTDDGRLLPLLSDYLPISFIGNVVALLALNLGKFIEISGRPRLATRAVIIMTTTNLLLDLLLVVGLRMGMKGAAIASMLSSVAAILSYVPYLMGESRPFRLVRIGAVDSVRLGARCMLRGVPAAIFMFTLAILAWGLNTAAMIAQGANGMFILSVCIQVLSISMLVIGGAGQTITGIGGRLYGEQDWKGMTQLFDSIFKIMLAGASATTVLICIFPGLFARLFGADEALISMSEQPLRLFCLILVPLSVMILMSSVYLITNRSALASAMQIAMAACILLPFWALSYWSPTNIWIAFPLGAWMFTGGSVGMAWVLSRREMGTHRIYLIPTIGNIDSYSVSVGYDFDEVQKKLSDLLFYIKIFDLDSKKMNGIEHCLEEIMFHQYNLGQKEGLKGWFDVAVVDQPERFTIVVKAVGKPYNPLVRYQPDTIDDIDEEQLDMIIVQCFGDDISYKYQNGLNCLYLNINK